MSNQWMKQSIFPERSREDESEISNLEPNVADANVRYQAVQIDHAGFS